jgi:hypothetical protein
MSKCEWPTCRQEATNGNLCYQHYRVYGTTSMTDKPVVDERERQRLFRAARKEYLSKHPVCEYDGCEAIGTDCHHRKGRKGNLFFAIEHFMAVCRKHHKQIEKDPKKAKELGYSQSRLSK